MINNLNYKHIFYFWVVAKYGSITKASSILNISQSSISDQIKTLEYDLGVKVFHRSKKGVSLTEYGSNIYDLLDQFIPKLEELFESLVNHKSTDVKFLNIGLAPTLSNQVRYAFAYPFIEDIHYTVKIHRGENEYLRAAFENNDIDIVLTPNENLSPNIKSEKMVLSRKKIVFVMRAEMQKNVSKLQDLDGYKFINYTSDSNLHFKLVDLLNSNKVKPIRIAEIDDIELVKSVLTSMDCFAALPLAAVTDEIKKKKMVFLKSLPQKLQPKLTVFYRKTLVNQRFNSLLQAAKSNLKLGVQT